MGRLTEMIEYLNMPPKELESTIFYSYNKTETSKECRRWNRSNKEETFEEYKARIKK